MTLVDSSSWVHCLFSRVISATSYGALVEALRKGRIPIKTADRRS